MQESDHISLERMHLVVTRCDVLMTEGERQHVQECRECLALYTEVVMSVTDDYDAGEE
jgi:hypothetical protein